MKKLLCSALLLGLAVIPAFAQGGGGAAQTPPAAPPTDPLATYVKGASKSVSNYLIHSAEDMPEENYSMKLGTTAEVRTYGALLGHVINSNFFYCARAKGEASPNPINYETTPQTKADLVKAMHAAMDYCGPMYDALTDGSVMEMVTPPAGGRGGPVLRGQMLIQNLVHNNEEYGNIVGYFRAKNLVPPSTALRSGGGRRGN
jgi:hypothetical protein